VISLSGVGRDVARLQRAIEGSNKRLSREINTAINATSRKTISTAAKGIGEELAATQKVIKQSLRVRKKSTPDTLSAVVRLNNTSRIPLKNLGARQNKKGVTYKVSKKRKRGFVKSAFVAPSIGNHAMKRRGKSRTPIIKLFGASPWGVYEKQKLDRPVRKATRKELRKQIQRRIRFIELKKSGAI